MTHSEPKSGEVKIAPEWRAILDAEFEKEYFKKLAIEVRAE